jgi:hypothetical protein
MSDIDGHSQEISPGAAIPRSDSRAELKPVDRSREDGAVYAGSLNGKPIYADPADAQVTYTFNQVVAVAAGLNRVNYLGYDDWRVPTKDELNLLYRNRDQGDLKGTFNLSGSFPDGWYWSSTEITSISFDGGWAQRFSDGTQSWQRGDNRSLLRLVRG